MKLITHDGTFHADEVFSTVILQNLYPDARLIRTRDLSIIEDDDIVYDVGLKYNDNNYFDHHQKDDSLVRENGIPYSSFGLVWKHFGEEYLTRHSVPTELIVLVKDFMDSTLVQAVDAIDNGLNFETPAEFPLFTVSNIIGNMNYSNTNSREQNEKFNDAVWLAYKIFFEQLKHCIKKAEDTLKVKEFILSEEDEVLILPMYMNFFEAIKETKIKYVVFPTDNSEYRIRSVHQDYNFDYDNLVIPDTSNYVFCHKSGFIAGMKSLESALMFISKNGA